MSLRVTSIQRGCVYDGPGVRTTVFLKGCLLRCPWCCNPETILSEEQIFANDSLCLKLKGIESVLCAVCERNGGVKLVSECPFGVADYVSRDYTPDELFHILLQDKELYRISGGGVTFSGGEPLLQVRDLQSVLVKLKEENVPIAFETSLVTDDVNIEIARKYADLFLVDLKIQPKMYLFEMEYIQATLSKLALLQGKDILFRMVFTDDVLEQKEEVLRQLQVFKVTAIEILRCHNLGEKKYEKLGWGFKSHMADLNKMQEFTTWLNSHHISVTLLSI